MWLDSFARSANFQKIHKKLKIVPCCLLLPCKLNDIPISWLLNIAISYFWPLNMAIFYFWLLSIAISYFRLLNMAISYFRLLNIAISYFLTVKHCYFLFPTVKHCYFLFPTVKLHCYFLSRFLFCLLCASTVSVDIELCPVPALLVAKQV
jgi:hypothetical protein